MSNTAVFARHTHPISQGSHSYSMALVSYETQEQLKELEKLLQWSGMGLPEPYGHKHQWFGGNTYDLIATFPTPPTTITSYKEKPNIEDITAKENKRSVGDHRWIGYYSAEELLNPKP